MNLIYWVNMRIYGNYLVNQKTITDKICQEVNLMIHEKSYIRGKLENGLKRFD